MREVSSVSASHLPRRDSTDRSVCVCVCVCVYDHMRDLCVGCSVRGPGVVRRVGGVCARAVSGAESLSDPAWGVGCEVWRLRSQGGEVSGDEGVTPDDLGN